MKGYRFYEEFESSYRKRKHQGSGNVLALDIDPASGRPYWTGQNCMECTAGVYAEPNSPIAGTAVSYDVLRLKYRRITEARAREIHPTLFAFLDQFDSEGNRKGVA